MQLGKVGTTETQKCVTHVLQNFKEYRIELIHAMPLKLLLSLCNKCAHSPCEYVEAECEGNYMAAQSDYLAELRQFHEQNSDVKLVLESDDGTEVKTSFLRKTSNKLYFQIEEVITPEQRLFIQINELIAQHQEMLTIDAPRATLDFQMVTNKDQSDILTVTVDCDEPYAGMPEVLSIISDLYDQITVFTDKNLDIFIVSKNV